MACFPPGMYLARRCSGSMTSLRRRVNGAEVTLLTRPRPHELAGLGAGPAARARRQGKGSRPRPAGRASTAHAHRPVATTMADPTSGARTMFIPGGSRGPAEVMSAASRACAGLPSPVAPDVHGWCARRTQAATGATRWRQRAPVTARSRPQPPWVHMTRSRQGTPGRAHPAPPTRADGPGAATARGHGDHGDDATRPHATIPTSRRRPRGVGPGSADSERGMVRAARHDGTEGRSRVVTGGAR